MCYILRSSWVTPWQAALLGALRSYCCLSIAFDTDEELLKELELRNVWRDFFDLVSTEGEGLQEADMIRNPFNFGYVIEALVTKSLQAYNVFKAGQAIEVSSLKPSLAMLLYPMLSSNKRDQS